MAKTVCLQLMLYLFICVEVMVIVGLSQLPQAVFSRAVYLHVCVYECVWTLQRPDSCWGLVSNPASLQSKVKNQWTTWIYVGFGKYFFAFFFWFSSVSRFTHQSFFRNKDLISNKINIILMVDSKAQTQCHFQWSYSKCIYYTVLKKPVKIIFR